MGKLFFLFKNGDSKIILQRELAVLPDEEIECNNDQVLVYAASMIEAFKLVDKYDAELIRPDNRTLYNGRVVVCLE